MNGFNGRLNMTKEGSGSIKTDYRIYSILSKENRLYIYSLRELWDHNKKKKKNTEHLCHKSSRSEEKKYSAEKCSKTQWREFPGSQMVRTCCHGLGFNPWLENKDPTSCVPRPKKSIDQSWLKKKKKDENFKVWWKT